MNGSLKGSRNTVGFSFAICLATALLFGWKSQSSLGGSPIQVRPAAPIDPYKNLLPIGPDKDILPAKTTTAIAGLGKLLFNDVNLSNPPGESCSSCHGENSGFKYPEASVNRQSGIAPGAVKGRFENRIPPTINYAVFLPQGPPQFTGTVEAFAGGLFWDGRVNDLVSQVPVPLQNPNEMNNTLHNVGDPAIVVQKVRDGPSAYLFRQLYGDNVFSQSTDQVFKLIVNAIASYESSTEISPFSSKYDAFINGDAQLTASELNGLQLFTGAIEGRPGGTPAYKNAQCVDCHGIPRIKGTGVDLWTNSCYDNIGVPRNPANPYYKMTNAKADPAGYNPDGEKYVDLGLGATFYPMTYNLPPGNIGPGNNGQGDFLGINGDFKAPTLRNVDKRPSPGFPKRYTHNGYFSDLKTIVHFYNTRNLTTVPGEVIDFTQKHPYAHLKGKPLWPKPEYSNPTTLQNATGDPDGQVGNLGLTDSEENDIVNFLKSLTDGYGKSYATGGLKVVTTPPQSSTIQPIPANTVQSHPAGK